MSAEVVAKKRGRPRKIVPDPVEVESIKTTATRPKSTKAIAKPVPVKTVTAKSATATKPIPASKAASIPVRKASAPKVVAPKSPPPKASTPAAAKTSQDAPPPVPKPVVKIEDRKEAIQGSKILSQVQDKHGSADAKFTTAQTSSKPLSRTSHKPAPLSTTTPVAAPIETTKQPVQSPPSVTPPTKAVHHPSVVSSTPPKPASMSSNPPPPPPKVAPTPKLPLAALNSAIVNNISTRAGAKPNTIGSKPLPPNYKSSARKITMIIVALPLLVFSSYGLYQRSDEVKLLFNPGSKKPDKDVESTQTPSSAS